MHQLVITLSIFIVSCMLALPNISFSMSHGHGDSHAEHSSKHHTGHDGMSAEGGMFIVGEMTSKGVRGMAHLKDVKKTMAEMGLKTTHHFMIAFADIETGEQIKTGKVALKLQDPDAKFDQMELIGMDGHFGADITLDQKGEYHFKLGTKLADGTKRKYHFHYTVE